jgi:hypothetical protein
VCDGFVMRSKQVVLGPYTTERLEYQFYFPSLGTFNHYPVHVTSEEQLVAYGHPTRLVVVNRPSVIDNSSWSYVSQQGSTEDALAFLNTRSLATVRTMRLCD